MKLSGFERLSLLTGSTMKSIARIKNNGMERFQLSGAHTNCLRRLLGGGMTQGELARAEGMDRSQVSRVLRALTERGFVLADAETGYKRRYGLTEMGAQTASEIANVIDTVSAYVRRTISDEEMNAFYRTYEKLTAGLEAAAQRFCAAEDGGSSDDESLL